MKNTLLHGTLALGLAVITPAIAQDASTTAAPAAPAAPTAPATPAAPAAPAAPTDPAAIRKDSSYGFGYQSGRRFASETARYGVTIEDIDRELFIDGFFAAFAGDDPGIEQAKLQAAMQALGTMLQEREKTVAEKNLEAGKAYLAENGKREGVTTTKSGLQYEILEKGGDRKYEAPADGKPDNSKFLVNYKGTMTDGTEFDASPEGQPVPMTMQVIPGFQEALKSMPVGAKWRLHIPSTLAYGEQRRSATIAPNSVLIFELELVDIQKQEAPKAVSPPIQIPPPAKQQ